MDVFPIDWPYGTLFRHGQRVTVDDRAGTVVMCRPVPAPDGAGWEFVYWVRVGDALREVAEDDIDQAEDEE